MPEKHKDFTHIIVLLDLFLEEPETLLYAWSQAALDEDSTRLGITDALKQRGIRQGITEEQFQRALEAARAVNHMFGEDNVAQS